MIDYALGSTYDMRHREVDVALVPIGSSMCARVLEAEEKTERSRAWRD